MSDRARLWDLLTHSDPEQRSHGLFLAADALGVEAAAFVAAANRARHLRELEAQIAAAKKGSIAAEKLLRQRILLLGLDQPQQPPEPTPAQLAVPTPRAAHLRDLLTAVRRCRLKAEAMGKLSSVTRLVELEARLAEQLQASEGGGASRADRLGRLAARVAHAGGGSGG